MSALQYCWRGLSTADKEGEQCEWLLAGLPLTAALPQNRGHLSESAEPAEHADFDKPFEMQQARARMQAHIVSTAPLPLRTCTAFVLAACMSAVAQQVTTTEAVWSVALWNFCLTACFQKWFNPLIQSHSWLNHQSVASSRAREWASRQQRAG
jgi:hypothetical protein